MKKQVILTVMEGSFDRGFPITLEIREDEPPFNLKLRDFGRLPPTGDIDLLETVKIWRVPA